MTSFFLMRFSIIHLFLNALKGKQIAYFYLAIVFKAFFPLSHFFIILTEIKLLFQLYIVIVSHFPQKKTKKKKKKKRKQTKKKKNRTPESQKCYA